MKLKTFVRSSESLDMRFFADVDVVGVAGAMLMVVMVVVVARCWQW